MKRLFTSGPMFTVFLNGAKARLININPCEFILIHEFSPDAKMAIEVNGNKMIALAKELKLTP